MAFSRPTFTGWGEWGLRPMGGEGWDRARDDGLSVRGAGRTVFEDMLSQNRVPQGVPEALRKVSLALTGGGLCSLGQKMPSALVAKWPAQAGKGWPRSFPASIFLSWSKESSNTPEAAGA